MPVNILMPALSPTMEKGNLAKWLKKEGDTVKSGDVIAEIETDKATMEVEAVDEGMLAKIVVPAGTADVTVNDLIAVIASEGEDPKTVGSAAAAAPGAKSPQNAADMVTAAAPRRRRRGRRTPGHGNRRFGSALCTGPVPQPAPPPLRRLPPSGERACSPRRSRGASPRRRASTSPRSPAPARTAAS